ncbi:hypothetical protein [Bacteroides caccae]|uniref:hypothetical protein n=1 Tax=Bacteroides caccae TaxID=47678 RepID=UPI003564F12A
METKKGFLELLFLTDEQEYTIDRYWERGGIFVLLLFILSVLPYSSKAQMSSDSLVQKIAGYIDAIQNFGDVLPQEKVYLHFDNTSYYQGDPIWFQCYVVTPGLNHPTELSKTLYVELLNPGGEIISKRVLPIRNGRCHSSFELTQLPFYSGFYEVRAYTKYMLNFGEEIIFSRVLPVFDKPANPGEYKEKNIQKYAVYKYPQTRKKAMKAKKVNLKFFPEGGNLVKGVPSQVAFEATDAYGNPITLFGRIINRRKEEIGHFATIHEGRGVFTYIPTGEDADKAEVELGGKKYRFDLPEVRSQGYVLHVDNLTSEDSIAVSVQKNTYTPSNLLGLAVIAHGKLLNSCLLNVGKNTPVSFKLDKSEWTPGVVQLVLFDTAGQIIADRLVFTRKPELLVVDVRKSKESYQPFERVTLDFSVRDTTGNPVSAPMSVSIRDGWEEVESRHSMLVDLLLMSEIKGYVHRPLYYFEVNDMEHRLALDCLLMVQGWRRYKWKYAAGVEPFELKYMPEQGIEVHGQVVSFVRGKPKPNMQVSSFLAKRGEEEISSGMTSFGLLETDSLGRFAFITNIEGKWNLILSVMEKGKKKDCRIILDRVFSPQPVRYLAGEMQVSVSGRDTSEFEQGLQNDTVVMNDVDYNRFMDAYEDSLARRGIQEKNHRLGEVVVKAKKWSREKDIFENRSKSVAYYDVPSEIDDIQDKGDYVGDDIHELLIRMNRNFIRRVDRNGEWLQYKGRSPLYVINYEQTQATEIDQTRYQTLRLEAIKSIYINEELSAKCRYADSRMSPLEVDEMYSCVVFIETYPEGEISVKGGKGVRKTWLEGYNKPAEFYHLDYSILPKEEDYRRTLYWNPEVLPDKAGNARVSFYNNGRCRKLKITAEMIAADGTIGMFNE